MVDITGLDVSNSGVLAIVLGLLAAFAVVFLVFYVYLAITLMFIAKKTNTPNAWLAWIPIANLYLMTQIAKVQWWTLLIVLFAGFVPVVGALASIGVTVWWWWKIAEVRNKPGWWGILMLVPGVNFVLMGILAWGK